jgi:energy-coupling factor transporter ATP-binding protein EcfA2
VKVSAIRLKEVGRFRDPVALEGLSGGLDVLAGPNEAGKSTIFKALRLALTAKHTSKTQDIEAFRPYAGGAPLVEVDLQIGNTRWRLRKQFLAGRAAELQDMSSGRLLRGADAESELERLLGRKDQKDNDPFGLVWVEQGNPAAGPQVKPGAPLLAALEAEAGAAAGSSAVRAVLALVRAELAEFVTSHAVPRPTGRYKAAIERQQELAARKGSAQARLDSAEARLAKLAELRAALQRLADPAAVAQRQETAEAARRVFEEAAAAREKYRQAHDAVVVNEERLHARKHALANLDGRLADLAKLEDAERTAGPALERAREAELSAKSNEDACRARHDDVKGRLAAAEAERKSAEVAARLAEADKKLEAARAAAQQVTALGAELKANAVDDAAIAAVRREVQSIATLQARLSAAAPTLSIAYATGAKAKISVAGRALEDGEVVSAMRPLTLEIPGIGVLTVAPGRTEGAEDDVGDLAAHEETLAGLLKKLRAASPEAAESMAAERRRLAGELNQARSLADVHAPDGLPALEKLCAELKAKVAGAGAAGTKRGRATARSKAELDRLVADLAVEVAAAEAALAEARQAHARAREGAIALREQTASRRARIEDCLAELGDEAQRKSARASQAAALAEAQDGMNRAVREETAWRDKAPDEARLTALERSAREAEAAKAEAERRSTEFSRDEARLEGELAADRADDVAATLAEASEALIAAERDLAAIKDEVGAAQLLARELETADSAARDRYTGPIMARLKPYLDLVFPELRARFGGDLALDAVQRGGASEDVARLSHGTQEQLAVLVRLGLARLMCQTGGGMPLVLDDALVYSDDQRIERMFAALKLASQSHQVLVLTCRERTFASLGGNRVEIVPWKAAA